MPPIRFIQSLLVASVLAGLTACIPQTADAGGANDQDMKKIYQAHVTEVLVAHCKLEIDPADLARLVADGKRSEDNLGMPADTAARRLAQVRARITSDPAACSPGNDDFKLATLTIAIYKGAGSE